MVMVMMSMMLAGMTLVAAAAATTTTTTTIPIRAKKHETKINTEIRGADERTVNAFAEEKKLPPYKKLKKKLS